MDDHETILAQLEANLRSLHRQWEMSRDPWNRAKLATIIKEREAERRAFKDGELQ